MFKQSLLTVAAAGIAVSAVLAPQFASAQTLGGDSQIDRPWRIHVGAFFPVDKSLRDLSGNTHFAVGGSYDVKQSLLGTNSLFQGVYVDGTFGNKSGGHSSVYGAGYKARLAFAAPTKQLNTVGYPYLGAGLGLYFVDDQFISNSTNIRLGGKLFAGFETPKGIFLEAAYSLIGSVDGYQSSGFTASLGYRF
jgi:hypothetical protein